jgi:hypothetical protein
MMVAEKAADIVRGDSPLLPSPARFFRASPAPAAA